MARSKPIPPGKKPKAFKLKAGQLRQKSKVSKRGDTDEFVKVKLSKLEPRQIGELESKGGGGLMFSMQVAPEIWMRVEAYAESPCDMGEEQKCIKDMFKIAAKAMEAEVKDALELAKRLTGD